jgi:DNA (cytosine-5)-methyltransferase 1
MSKSMHVGIVDFFCGCGGASSGFAQASVPGCKVSIVAGLDLDPHSCATFERMHDRPAHNIDIAGLLDDEEQLAGLLQSWDLNRFDKVIFIGCAPCQGFAAHRKSVKGRDARRNLFVAFCELAAKLKPDAIFMENVPDLFSTKHWAYYEEGSELLKAAGYHVRSRIFNFAGFGLPQERFRAVMLAMPKDFEMPKPLLEPGRFRTVREAIGHLPKLEAGAQDPHDPMHKTSHHRASTIEILRQVPKNGGNRPTGVGPSCLDRAREDHGGYTDVYGRIAWDRPSLTITARCRTPSCGRFAHPEQDRGLTIREAALLQGFPPDFMFEGPFDDKFKQVGNAVPPLVARHVAEHLLKTLKSKARVTVGDRGADIVRPVGAGFAVTINGIKRRRSVERQEAFRF